MIEQSEVQRVHIRREQDKKAAELVPSSAASTLCDGHIIANACPVLEAPAVSGRGRITSTAVQVRRYLTFYPTTY